MKHNDEIYRLAEEGDKVILFNVNVCIVLKSLIFHLSQLDWKAYPIYTRLLCCSRHSVLFFCVNNITGYF